MDKTLVIKLGALGDVALCLPLLRHLAANDSSNRMIVTTPPFAELMESVCVGRVVVLSNRSTFAVLRLGLKLRREKFSRVLDLQGKRHARLLTWLAGPRAQRVGTWPRWPYHIAPDFPELHHPEQRWPELAKVMGLPGKIEPRVEVAVKFKAQIAKWLADHQLTGRRLVLIHAGCSRVWQTKRWPAAHFEQVALRLRDAAYRVLWLGTNEERDLNVGLARTVGLDATGAFRLPELLALAQVSSFAITNDSGPMHLFAIGGLPVYALFGPVDPDRSHAWGQRQRVVDRPLPCRPCYKKNCPLPGATHDCLAGLPPQQLVARLALDGWLPAT